MAILKNTAPSALDTARQIFVANGFAVEVSDSELIAIGPGMNSTSQNPLVGVSRARVVVSKDVVRFVGELGGVRKMQRLVYLLPLALGISFGLIFGLTFSFRTGLSALLPVLPWAIGGPIMSQWLKNRTIQAVEILLQNAANS